MSYLAALRVHFAGRFQAAPSTVNNDVTHYDVATFKKEYQRLQEPGSPNGWWNPRGDADWRLIGCRVTGASHADGSPAGAGDPVLKLLVADSDRQVTAKLVDLDPQQQLASVIWGLVVRICDDQGSTLLRGRFVPAPFVDIWTRAEGPGGAGDIGACAAYQSVLGELEWGDVAGSSWLTELRAAATDGLLSIRFSVDGYNMTFGSPEFTRGRIVGTIGVAHAAEPRHFVTGRQFMPVAGPAPGFFTPAGSINFCTAVVDRARGRILLDLGNALPTRGPGGPPVDHGELWLGYVAAANAPPTPIGTIDYRAAGWYERTAGVVEVPVDAAQLSAVASARLVLRLSNLSIDTFESPGGVYVRPDNFVYHLDPGDSADVHLFATRLGQPYAGAQVISVQDSSGLQGGDPAVAEPADALAFPPTLTTGADGRATLELTASDPGNPRGYIDGQVYGVRSSLADEGPDYPTDPWTFVSVFVWNEFVADDPVTWWGSLQPIFQQYANLYPVMDRFLDMSDYEAVCDNQELLRLAFGLDLDDPNSMPVTRDLSRSKRMAILRWLDAPGPDGRPLLGTPPSAPAEPPEALDELGPASGAAPQPLPQPRRDRYEGGKAAAAERRLVIPGSDAQGGRA